MSLDASYILVYDALGYGEPTPMKRDMEYLKNKHGGEFDIFDGGYSIFWWKPKYTLLDEDIQDLMADQILERRDCERWEIIK